MKHVFASAIVVLLALPAYAGATYRFRTYTEPAKSELAGTVAIDGSRMKVTFEKGDQLFFKSGSVVISTDGGKTLNILDTKKKTYTPLNISEVFSSVISMAKSMSGMFDLSITNQKVSVKPAGPGGLIQGFQTQKYIVDASYNMKMTLLGTTTDARVVNRTEAWTTEQISRDLISFIQLKGFKTGLPDIDKLMESQAGALKGFPLKQVTTSTSRSGKNVETTKTTVEITAFRMVNLAPGTFTIPANYKKQNLSALH